MTTISCACGYTAATIQEILAHQDTAHPERRAARIESLRNLKAALTRPAPAAAEFDN